jgi:FlaG/FlaF family flagellin (archaellin)
MCASCCKCISLYCKPHADVLDGQIYTIGTLIIFLSMFLSLAMKTDVSKEASGSQQAFAVILVLLNVAMILAAVVQMWLVGRRGYLSRQSSMLGLRKIHHQDDTTTADEAAVVSATIGTAAAATTENDITIEENSSTHISSTTGRACEPQESQSELRF